MCKVIGKAADGLTPAQETMCDLWLTERAMAIDLSGIFTRGLARHMPEGLVIRLSTGHVVTPYRGELVPYLNPTMTTRRREQPYKMTRADYEEWVQEAVDIIRGREGVRVKT
jgi:hypothetical protein